MSIIHTPYLSLTLFNMCSGNAFKTKISAENIEIIKKNGRYSCTNAILLERDTVVKVTKTKKESSYMLNKPSNKF